MANVTWTEIQLIQEILKKYFWKLQDGSVELIVPEPDYSWQFYKGEMTPERLERGLGDIDGYMSFTPQRNWAISHYGKDTGEFEEGPGLLRLGKPQRLALFQEIDKAYAWLVQHNLCIHTPPPSQPAQTQPQTSQEAVVVTDESFFV